MNHVQFDALVAYWLGDLDEAQEAAVEKHYFGCAECTARLVEIEALAGGVRRAYAGGLVGAVVTPAFVEHLRERGLRLREYRVAPNGSVNCTVAAEDDVLLSRLQAPLEGVERVDVITAGHRLEDVEFDAGSGEVVVAPSINLIRALPAHRHVFRLIAVSAEGERMLGEYTFNHSPS